MTEDFDRVAVKLSGGNVAILPASLFLPDEPGSKGGICQIMAENPPRTLSWRGDHVMCFGVADAEPWTEHDQHAAMHLLDRHREPLSRVSHTAWTIRDNSEIGMDTNLLEETRSAQRGRPRDWGNPGLWTYSLAAFEAVVGTRLFRHYCHCWTNVRVENERDIYALFAKVIVSVEESATPAEICGPTHLLSGDVWEPSWGDSPPYYQT